LPQQLPIPKYWVHINWIQGI